MALPAALDVKSRHLSHVCELLTSSHPFAEPCVKYKVAHENHRDC